MGAMGIGEVGSLTWLNGANDSNSLHFDTTCSQILLKKKGALISIGGKAEKGISRDGEEGKKGNLLLDCCC
jgi:hypothetical protein